MGLKEENVNASADKTLNEVMNIVLDIRKEIKAKKDFAASDKLRDDLSKINITIKDTKEATVWSIEQ